jgi:crotonobetainyl-CoA:carnitine CoA-transferase CaiB-like acyl-CoA transferase
VQIAVGNDAIWRRFASLVDIEPDDPRFVHNGDRRENSEALDELIAQRLAGADVAAWLERFAEHGVPAGEVRSLDQVYASAQVASQGLVVETDHATLGPIRTPGPPLRFGRSPGRDHLAPPTLGQHSRTVAAWLEEEGE